MTSTPRDDNHIPTLLGTLDTDGKTVVSIKVNPTAKALKVANGSTGTDYPYVNSQRDANRVPTIWGVSSLDYKTPIPIYTDSNGNLLTQTT